MEPERYSSGYYFEGDNVVARILGDREKIGMTNLVNCLDEIF